MSYLLERTILSADRRRVPAEETELDPKLFRKDCWPFPSRALQTQGLHTRKRLLADQASLSRGGYILCRPQAGIPSETVPGPPSFHRKITLLRGFGGFQDSHTGGNWGPPTPLFRPCPGQWRPTWSLKLFSCREVSSGPPGFHLGQHAGSGGPERQDLNRSSSLLWGLAPLMQQHIAPHTADLALPLIPGRTVGI